MDMARLLFTLGLMLLLSPAGAGGMPDLLTPAERAWLAEHPRITLGVGAEWAPDVIQVGEGRITGFAVDHLRLLADKLGIEIGLEAGPWHAMVAAAESRQLDGLMLAAPLSERRDHFLFTDDFHTVYLFLYQRDADPLPALPSIAGLRGRRIGYLQDVLRVRRLLAGEPSIVALPQPSQAALAEALLTGAVDAAIGAYDLEYWRASNGVLGFGPKRMLPEEAARLGISIRKDWPELVGILNKGLAAITPEESAALHRRWFGRLGIQGPELVPLALSAEERTWIERHRVVRVGIDPAWAPVEFLDEDRQPQGISVAYLRALESSLGLRFEFIETRSWSETLSQFEAGRLDLLPAIAVTPERQTRFHLTSPYVSFPAVIFTAADVAYLGDISALADRTVAVIEDESIHDWLRAEHPEIRLLPVADTRAALRQVAGGEAFAFVGNLATTSYYIGATGLTQIKVLGETPFVYRLGMAVHRDQPELAAILQKALDDLPKHTRDAIYHDWVSIRYDHGTDLGLLWRVVAGATLLLTLAGWWTLRLSRAESALREAKERAEQADQAKSAFLANISHELRTPLNLVLGLASRLQEARLAQRERHWVEAIGTAGRSLSHLIEDLLDLSRIEAGRLDLHPRAVDPRALLDELIVVFDQRAADKGLGLRRRIAEPLPATLWLDEARLRQILMNLVGNAVKFTERGGIELGVMAEPTAGGRWHLRLSVADTGPGIAPDEQRAIFEPFTQGSAGQRTRGAGLGLAISRRLARLMGGDIRLEPSAGSGSTFVLDLPEVAIPDAATSEPGRIATAHARLSGEPAPLPIDDDRPPAGHQILIVEDDAAMRGFVGHLLTDAGYRIYAADTGRLALQIAEQALPDLILLDIHMPDLDGIATCRRLKALTATQSIPIVFLTGRDDEPSLLTAFDAGAADYVVKPFEPRVLLARVRAHAMLGALSRGLEHALDERTHALEAANVRLRRLALDLALLEETARAKLANELHDSPMQKLALAQIQIEAATQPVDAETPSRLAAGRELLRQAIGELRTLQFDLSPPVLATQGLAAALAGLAESLTARWSVPLSFVADSVDPPHIDRETSIVLFQCARELVYNLLKHAHARHGLLRLRTRDGCLELIVEDDGIGLAPSQLEAPPRQGQGFGLYSVRERLALLGGELRIESAAPGARLIVRLPWDNADDDPAAL